VFSILVAEAVVQIMVVTHQLTKGLAGALAVLVAVALVAFTL